MSPSSPTPNEYTREERFAVVMYGGVSLAIYINGIAQELLRMVRATAPAVKDGPALKYEELRGSERVYRKLSYLLEGEDPDKQLAQDAHPPARFVIDIISGTSAGGINGVFLAKALVNGQNIDQLKQLWVREGAIEKLINDRFSVDAPLTLQDPPTALLNGQRMYFELLKAFVGMSPGGNTAPASPLIKELDLFVTTTDLHGVTLPIRLTDDVVYERRHRNVFRFIYEEESGKNDFTEAHNPFLAYAARCTSAFPFAFEPMTLFDADMVLERYGVYADDPDYRSDSEKWKPFYRTYANAAGFKPVPFPKRAFGDGGYLDNKPFTYAIETLTRRQASVPVTRKLIYVEPSPEHPEDTVDVERKPNAIENVLYALLTLPRYETIREDLQRVVERNRLIQRVNAIIKGVEQDEVAARRIIEEQNLDRGALPEHTETGQLWNKKDLSDSEWATLDLTDMIRRKGRAYIAYHRLEMSAVTDELAKLVARVGGLDEQSDYAVVIRNLVRVWRINKYVERRRPGYLTVNAFMNAFNLSYRIRRLGFLQRKADQLHALDAQAVEILGNYDSSGELKYPLTPQQQQDIREELKEIKVALKRGHDALRKLARKIRSRHVSDKQLVSTGEETIIAGPAETTASAPTNTGPTETTNTGPTESPLYGQVKKLFEAIRKTEEIQNTAVTAGVDPVLQYFLGNSQNGTSSEATKFAKDPVGEAEKSPEQKSIDRAEAFVERHADIRTLFEEVADGLETAIRKEDEFLNPTCLKLLDEEVQPPNSARTVARTCMRYYYKHYDDYDMIIVPIFYDTEVGEAAKVEVFRISPEDATGLIDERATGSRKLAGTVLGNFGAFLERRWRENDILWGRLDGAERIICSILPPKHPQLKKLIGEAQAAIVHETIVDMGEQEARELLSESMIRTGSRTAEPDLLGEFISNLKNNASADDKQALEKLIDDRALRQYYLDTYNNRRQPDPQLTLSAAARATTVIGKILSTLSEERNIDTRYVSWIARIGQIFWSLVEVAVPRSIPNLMFRHWLKLVYLFEVVLIIASTLLVSPTIQRFGILTFAITVAIHFVVWVLGDIIKVNRRWTQVLKYLGLFGVAGFVVLGIIFLAALLGIDPPWRFVNYIRGLFDSQPKDGVNREWAARILASLAFFLFFIWVIRDDLWSMWGRGFKKPVQTYEPIEIMPISIDDINKVKVLKSGDRFEASFRLSGIPPKQWATMFKRRRPAGSSLTDREIRLVSHPAEVEAVFAGLQQAVNKTNLEYERQLEQEERQAAELKQQSEDLRHKALEKDVAVRAAIKDALNKLRQQ